MKRINVIQVYFTVIPLCLMLFSSLGYAQLNPLGTSYYRNQYLNNPAMAGIEQGLAVNLAYRLQWNSLPGAPESQSITGDYGLNDRVGLGLNVYNDKAGLQKWTRAVATYAYHLPLNENDRLHFGISIGFSHDRLNEEDVTADPNDLSIGRYNQRETYIDGDFGVAYTAGGFSLQGAIPNMKQFLKRDEEITTTIDRSSFFASAGYKFNLEQGDGGITLEPKVSFRGIRGYDNIIDIGANASILNDQIQLFGLYHTSQSATYGFGFQYKAMNISGMYTSETSAIRGNANGNFEISLKFTGLRKK